MGTTKNEIQKASIKNDRCNVIFKENTENDINSVNKSCGAIIHPDLIEAFNKLKVHLAVITEQPEQNQINLNNIDDFDITILDNYTITGYSIGGTDEHSGVTIIGQKLLKSGSILNLVAPFTKYDGDYPFSEQLGLDVKGCNYEVEQYLFHNKFGVKQESIDFEMPEESDINLANAAESVGDNMVIKHHNHKKRTKKELLEAV